MQALSRQGLLALADREDGALVSIFLPTHGAGPDERQDAMRLRNLLRDAEHRLDAAGMRGGQSRRLLAPAAELAERPAFWRAPGGGLALFLAEGDSDYLRLPQQPHELVVVGRRFHVKPLLPLLGGSGRFYVLALSQGQVRLFAGDREQLRAAKDRILRYFREVDRGVHAAIRDAHAPLVLAAVDYLVPIYHAASTHPHLLEWRLHCNPDRLDPVTLHQRAWAAVGDSFRWKQRAAAAHWRRLAGTGLAISDLRQVVLDAIAGRVETLLVPMDAERWGVADAASGTVEVHEHAQPGDFDLLDLAMVETLRHHGNAYPLDPAESANGSQPAAILRCPKRSPVVRSPGAFPRRCRPPRPARPGESHC